MARQRGGQQHRDGHGTARDPARAATACSSPDGSDGKEKRWPFGWAEAVGFVAVLAVAGVVAVARDNSDEGAGRPLATNADGTHSPDGDRGSSGGGDGSTSAGSGASSSRKRPAGAASAADSGSDSLTWANARFRDALSGRPAIPTMQWPEGAPLSRLSELTIAEHRRLGGGPVLVKGAPLGEWDAWKTLSATPAEWLSRLHAIARRMGGDEGRFAFRPKVGNTSLFQYFQSSVQDRWRRDFGVEPPPTEWRWDVDCTHDEQLALLDRGGGGGSSGKGGSDDGSGGGASEKPAVSPSCAHSFAYWITRATTTGGLAPDDTQRIPEVERVLRSSSLPAERFLVGPTFGRPGPITGKPLDDVTVNLWVTTAGVANNLHYDASWNYLVHASGPKRVAVAPIRARSLLHLYPRAHPSLRSSPVDLRRPWAELVAETPGLEGAGVAQATLEPGDVLMIPPMWLHFLFVGSEPTASFSFFTDVTESELGSLALPRMTEGAAVSFATRIFKRFHGGDCALAAAAVQRALSSSYEWDSGVASLLCPPSGRHGRECDAAVTAGDKARAKAVATEVMNLVDQLRGREGGAGGGRGERQVPEDSLAYLVEQWVEDLLLDTVGPTATCGALKRCVLPALSGGAGKMSGGESASAKAHV